VVAVPVAPRDTIRELAAEVDEVVTLLQPDPFVAVGRWYHDFHQTTDAEVRELLAAAARTQAERAQPASAVSRH
jgi:putative phosphoribosyl transferase